MKKLLPILFLILSQSVQAEIWLSSIFSDHMVLQQQSILKVWGWTSNTIEPVSVTGSWNNVTVTREAWQGRFEIEIETPPAGGPYTLTIAGHDTIILNDVLVGEVWLASGQSNMQWSANRGFDNAAEEVKNANYPNIRFFQVPQHQADSRQQDTPGKWTACTPETMADFSAVAYFFGRELQNELNVPVGLINSSWGGTPAEVWMPEEVVKNNPVLADANKVFKESHWHSFLPGKMFNSMIAPLVPFRIAGCIWYQGETNHFAPLAYGEVFPALVDSWRREWNYDFPFYYVQIAPFGYAEKNSGVLVREAQLKAARKIENSGMVVVSDIGNPRNIHPGNKQEVGKRLAKWALANDYGFDDLAFSGPLYREAKKRGNKMQVFFDYSNDGLLVKGDKLTHFEIAGDDRKFYPAEATIENNTVVVWNKDVKDPMAVRFAWDDVAEPNLFNTAGLPASCFRTDDWPVEVVVPEKK